MHTSILFAFIHLNLQNVDASRFKNMWSINWECLYSIDKRSLWYKNLPEWYNTCWIVYNDVSTTTCKGSNLVTTLVTTLHTWQSLQRLPDCQVWMDACWRHPQSRRIPDHTDHRAPHWQYPHNSGQVGTPGSLSHCQHLNIIDTQNEVFCWMTGVCLLIRLLFSCS